MAQSREPSGHARAARGGPGRHLDLADRLLYLGRLDEAIAEVRKVEGHTLLDLANLFVARGHGEAIERVVRERSGRLKDIPAWDWLKGRALARRDWSAARELALKAFAEWPNLDRVANALRYLLCQPGQSGRGR